MKNSTEVATGLYYAKRLDIPMIDQALTAYADERVKEAVEKAAKIADVANSHIAELIRELK